MFVERLKRALMWLVGIAGVLGAVFLAFKRNLAKVAVPSMPQVDPETLKQVAVAEAQAEVVREQAAVEVKNEVEEIRKIAKSGALGSERRKRLAKLAKKE
jgi:hypothetical protein